MGKGKNKCIVLLSEKSSGSSAIQEFLSKYLDVKHVSKTRHYQYETLYWTKAASLLKKPQIKMTDSEVPIAESKAKEELVTLLRDNVNSYIIPEDNNELVIKGWEALCSEFNPVFFEKSPHHLCQWSAIELILEAMERIESVDFLIVGLIRNPMDTIYSQYKRWLSVPDEVEKQWQVAYNNLIRLQKIVPSKVFITRYEDIVTSNSNLLPILEFCNVEYNENDFLKNDHMHTKSIQKWKSDKYYGHILSSETITLANHFGYINEDLNNSTFLLWKTKFYINRTWYKIVYKLKKIVKATLINHK